MGSGDHCAQRWCGMCAAYWDRVSLLLNKSAQLKVCPTRRICRPKIWLGPRKPLPADGAGFAANADCAVLEEVSYAYQETTTFANGVLTAKTTPPCGGWSTFTTPLKARILWRIDFNNLGNSYAALDLHAPNRFTQPSTVVFGRSVPLSTSLCQRPFLSSEEICADSPGVTSTRSGSLRRT